MRAYVYSNEDENYQTVIDEIEGESNKEIDTKFEDKYGSNDYNYTFVDPR